ncbi:ectonucleoside triphosphate diphosphohydrolase 5-like [Amphiura filiformis]|uniref:ectonucleoside triphosphate diphosphohydrolase 5-like n=1 Tax=Amphiura filiformis TaxID=82378 RepID=UPI003B20F74D
MKKRTNYTAISVLAIIIISLFIIVTSIYNGTFSFSGATVRRKPVNILAALKDSETDFSYHQFEMSSENKVLDNREDKDEANFYGVMFDAGSTGSRVHVFHFWRDSHGGPPMLLTETYEEIKKPLSNYSDDPIEGARTLEPLLTLALDHIPISKLKSTPVALKATAGLRLLPAEKAQALLDAVYDLFKRCPLQVFEQSRIVNILEGVDEGLYEWVTVNFIRGSLARNTTLKTKGILDLGGGSTQITFAPIQGSTIAEGIPSGYIKQRDFFGKSYQLYTHSYLGLGLKAARLGIMLTEQGNPSGLGDTVNSTTGLVEVDPMDMFAHGGSKNLSSSCLPPYYVGSWEFTGLQFATHAISSTYDGISLYDRCMKITSMYLSTRVHRPEEIASTTFYAVSYFWAYARDLGLVDHKIGGATTVGAYINAAKKACSSSNLDEPFLCMDLVFISTLLRHGYGLNKDTKILAVPKIDEVDISWALGATINLLRNHWDYDSR